MSVVEELYKRTYDGQGTERAYLIIGAADEVEARTDMLAVAPSSVGDYARKDKSCQVNETDEAGTYEGRCVYGVVVDPTSNPAGGGDLDVGDTRISFDIAGATTHITQSLQTISSSTPNGEPTPNHHGTIGLDPQGNVQGVDVETLVFDFEIIKIVNSTSVNTALVAAAAVAKASPVSSAVFSHSDSDGRSISLAAGATFFRGMTTAHRGNGEDELRYGFSGSSNLTDIAIGPDITVPAKGGWEHLWVQYVPAEDDTAHMLLQRPRAAFVERIYNTSDLKTLLGL